MSKQTKDQRIAELERALLKTQRAARRLYFLAIPGAPGWLEIEAREIMNSISFPNLKNPHSDRDDVVR